MKNFVSADGFGSALILIGSENNLLGKTGSESMIFFSITDQDPEKKADPDPRSRPLSEILFIYFMIIFDKKQLPFSFLDGPLLSLFFLPSKQLSEHFLHIFVSGIRIQRNLKPNWIQAVTES